MVQLCQNHWKTIDGNGGLKKNINHSIALKNWPSLWSTHLNLSYKEKHRWDSRDRQTRDIGLKIIWRCTHHLALEHHRPGHVGYDHNGGHHNHGRGHLELIGFCPGLGFLVSFCHYCHHWLITRFKASNTSGNGIWELSDLPNRYNSKPNLPLRTLHENG